MRVLLVEDESLIAADIAASDSGMPILVLTAADRLADKRARVEAQGARSSAPSATGRSYLTKPFELQDRRRAHSRPPVREIAGLRLDPSRREVYRDGRDVAVTRKQFAVLEVLVAAEGGVESAEEVPERPWDRNASRLRS